jgi:AbrB family looped-hinge helix DNA binding protein
VAKVTSKLQVTVPKAIADRFGIRPGDEIEWVAEGNAIRVLRQGGQDASADRDARLKSFDAGTKRQGARDRVRREGATDRGWAREDLYERGRSR